ARLKLKGIDGDPHKRWSMWFNSMQREEPYLPLTSRVSCRDAEVPRGTRRQVLHGCRQLVSRDAGISTETSATLVPSCKHFWWDHQGDRRLQGGARLERRIVIL